MPTGVKDALARGKAMRKLVQELKDKKVAEKEARKSSGALSLASGASSPAPENPPVSLDERMAGPGTLTLGELMKSEKLSYGDALKVFVRAFASCGAEG